MELRHLRYFQALAHCLHFTRAAEQMHVTQSTLSHQIRQLEEEIGTPLFDRIGKRVLLTDAGESFLIAAEKALKAVDEGLNTLRSDSSALQGVIRIGTTHTFNVGFLPDCVATFREKFPAVRIIIEELSADDICAQLGSGVLDIGIAYEPVARAELVFEPLYHEEMVLVVSTAHALAHRKRIRMIELHNQPLVLLSHHFATRNMLDACFKASGAEPFIPVEMNTISPILELVARSNLATIVAATTLRGREDLRAIPLENPTPFRTPGILRRNNYDEQPAYCRTFCSIVRTLSVNSR